MAGKQGPEDHWWTVDQVAEWCEVEPGTIRAYSARKQMPDPDWKIGRTSLWLEATIKAWRPWDGNTAKQPLPQLPPLEGTEALQGPDQDEGVQGDGSA